MNRLVYLLMVGLAFTVLQISTVAAETGAPGAPPMGDPNMPPPTGAPGAPPMGDPTMAPPTGAPGTPPAGDVSHCAQFSGPPKAACEAAAAGK